jgi:SRSO17 transposase
MTKDLLQAIGPEFTAFLRPFERFFDNPGTVQHFRNYTRGLLTDLDRKTAEPLAKYAGTPARCLQQFLKACLWDHDGLTDGVQQALHAAVAELPPDPVGTVCILDETSALKKGTKTPGVQRQYLGCAGKVANGIVTVHLVVAHGPFKALLDSELFLPESWDADRERCREADIPDEVRYRSKWEIGLELLARTERNGWRFDWLTFDEWYGGKPGFLRVLDVAALRYVGEVPKTFSCRPGPSRTALSAEAVFAQPGVKKRAAKSFRLEQQTGPAAVWQAKVMDVALGTDGRPRHRLILARNRQTGEKKYFLTNAPRRIGLRRVLLAAFVRWPVEHMFRVAKSEVGLTHFEGRSYVSLKRHLALCLVALAFVSLHTTQLRGEKSGHHPGTSLPNSGAGCQQQRNAAATKSRRKRPRKLRRFAAL